MLQADLHCVHYQRLISSAYRMHLTLQSCVASMLAHHKAGQAHHIIGAAHAGATCASDQHLQHQPTVNTPATLLHCLMPATLTDGSLGSLLTSSATSISCVCRSSWLNGQIQNPLTGHNTPAGYASCGTTLSGVAASMWMMLPSLAQPITITCTANCST